MSESPDKPNTISGRIVAVVAAITAVILALAGLREAWDKLFPPVPSAAVAELDPGGGEMAISEVASKQTQADPPAAPEQPEPKSVEAPPPQPVIPPGVTPGRSHWETMSDGPFAGQRVQISYGPAMPGFPSPPVGNWYCVMTPPNAPGPEPVQACFTLQQSGSCSCPRYAPGSFQGPGTGDVVGRWSGQVFAQPMIRGDEN